MKWLYAPDVRRDRALWRAHADAGRMGGTKSRSFRRHQALRGGLAARIQAAAVISSKQEARTRSQSRWVMTTMRTSRSASGPRMTRARHLSLSGQAVGTSCPRGERAVPAVARRIRPWSDGLPFGTARRRGGVTDLKHGGRGHVRLPPLHGVVVPRAPYAMLELATASGNNRDGTRLQVRHENGSLNVFDPFADQYGSACAVDALKTSRTLCDSRQGDWPAPLDVVVHVVHRPARCVLPRRRRRVVGAGEVT